MSMVGTSFSEDLKMDRQDLERIITYFQAKAHGFLVRKELSGVRQDYEDIVREIEGDHSHLEWRGDTIAVPSFTKNAFVWQSNKGPSNENSGEPHSISELGKPSEETSEEVLQVISDSPVAVRELHHQQGQFHCVPAVRDSESSKPVGGDGERTRHTSELNLSTETHSKFERLEGGEPVSSGEAETSAWDSAAMHPGYCFLEKGSFQRSLAKDIPRKEDELCLHRNNLSMELLWLQQAIDSRKKYLLLKQRLGILER